MKALRNIFTLLAVLCFSANIYAEDYKWYNPMEAGFPVVQNQAWTSEIGTSYHRLPERAMTQLRGAVWNLSRYSAGLALHFYTNANNIKVKYVVEGPLAMHHMPATGASGLDLYGIDQDGKPKRFFGFFNGYPDADTLVTSFVNDRVKQYHAHGYEFHLYLPPYNIVKQLEIGVPVDAEFSFIPKNEDKPIVVYGTSIEQGGVASRPAMIWPTIIERSLAMPVVNLGFSGNGRLEKGVLDLMTEIDAKAYVLSCLANLTESSPEELDSLLSAAYNQLRAHSGAPIVFTEHSGFSDAGVNQSQYDIIEELNSTSKAFFKKLQDVGEKNIYYISREDMNISDEGWVDDVHLSDLGMTQLAAAVETKLREALKMPVGDISTTIPVTQRREPDHYEWLTRHRAMLERNKKNPPKSVIIGNSITHFWGGEPVDYVKNGPKIWNKYLEPRGFGNLGCGWDRLENALWRVYHGELDGYDAEQVVLMIGTNNFGLNSDKEIVDGLRFLISAVKDRQPKAKIKVVGILPRWDAVERSQSINKLIQAMAESEGCRFVNPGVKLLNKDGSLNASLFTDGLHPNEQGYSLIVEDFIN